MILHILCADPGRDQLRACPDLGDERLNRRLGLLADQLAERPSESFPKALDDVCR